ncbi:9d7973e3-4f96-429b-872a-4399d5845192 [Thermothielavioides terrestris]|uniref:9d7973e3-4f96-429b-872a-4399d5845192 n=1 Tax=Thermothielavioides terrestris TaxID=2587410 RepID=A0A446B783_9PEZI|nr:9d7973e3-4f96-429b-872a-4399d5845192 [Thermothielavioides terrestris]
MSSYSSAEDAYDSDEPPELDLDLTKLVDRASLVLGVKCISAKKLTRGASHEIFTLRFEESPAAPESLAKAGFLCIARFARVNGDVAKSVSEIATARYLRRFTDIPVPEIYYHDLDPGNDIGAPFVLMEKMPGRHLHKMWDGLSREDKKSALSQIASVVAKLASLQFDQIGSLNEHGVGPLVSPCFEQPKGPFRSTDEYLRSFISTESVESSALRALFQEAQQEIGAFLARNSQATYLQPPFCLIHADFDGQNMLFLEPADGSGPKLAGLIDFEYAHTGPLYFLYEYPIFIQDVSWSKELYAENAVLRAHFVRAIYQALPSSEAQSTFIAAMNDKSFALNGFRDSFMRLKCSEKTLINSTAAYIQELRDGTGLAYSGRLDYTPERYTERGELVSADTTTQAGSPLNGSGHQMPLEASQSTDSSAR